MPKQITINITNEMIGYWLSFMLEAEIGDTEGTIENEKLWAKGSANEDEEQMHLENMETLKEYKNVLTQALNELKGE